jgi:hypothetical protein
MKTCACCWDPFTGKSATVKPTPWASENWSLHLAVATGYGGTGRFPWSHSLRDTPARKSRETRPQARSTFLRATAVSMNLVTTARASALSCSFRRTALGGL